MDGFCHFLASFNSGTHTHLTMANRLRVPPHRVLELHKALRKQGLDVSKAQKGELRIAEDQAVEMRRRVELQVLWKAETRWREG